RMDRSRRSFWTPRRRLRAGAGHSLLILTLAVPGSAVLDAFGTSSQELALWMRDARRRPGHADAGMVKLDESARLPMRIRHTRALLPIVTGGTGRSNMYVDICVPVDAFEVVPSPAWPTVEVDRWDCVPYSTYIPAADGGVEAAPREPLRFRALSAGAFTFRYKIVAADSRPVQGEFSVLVAP